MVFSFYVTIITDTSTAALGRVSSQESTFNVLGRVSSQESTFNVLPTQ